MGDGYLLSDAVLEIADKRSDARGVIVGFCHTLSLALAAFAQRLDELRRFGRFITERRERERKMIADAVAAQ